MNVIHGQDRHLPRSLEFSPEKHAVGCIIRKPATVVGLNDGFGSVAKKLKEIIQITVGSGAHIRRVHHMLAEVISAIDLKLPVGLFSSIGERQEA